MGFSRLFSMERHSNFIDSLKDVVDMVWHCIYFIKLFSGSRREEFAVLVEMHGIYISVLKSSLVGEFAGSSGFV